MHKHPILMMGGSHNECKFQNMLPLGSALHSQDPEVCSHNQLIMNITSTYATKSKFLPWRPMYVPF